MKEQSASIESLPRDWYDPKGRRRCPTCDSTRPGLHPAMGAGGEVQPCPDDFHGCKHEVTPTDRQCALCLAYVPVPA